MASLEFYHEVQALVAQREAGATLEALARATGWQPASVRTLIARAKNGRLRPPQARPGAWSMEMDTVLIDLWETHNANIIAARVSRKAKRAVSHWAVNARARRIGLEKPGHPVHWTEERRT